MMKSQNLTEILDCHGLLDWNTLLVGFNRRWATKLDVINYAVKWLLSHPSETNDAIILLAGAEEYNDDEIRTLLAEADDGGALAEEISVDKWRLAHLYVLAKVHISYEEKVDRLEELYARFDYPNDMYLCTRYGPSQEAVSRGFASADEMRIGPLEAMQKVIKDLKDRLGCQGGGDKGESGKGDITCSV